MKDEFYITTPIYYVNDKPHIGHAYTTIIADILARFNRLKGRDVLFLTGTDEHGEKIERAAGEAGEDPQNFVDELVPSFKEAWDAIDVSYDQFIRTTDERHEDLVKRFVRRIDESGDIYEGRYEGWYCVPCETFWPERKLDDGNCPECGRPVEKRSHETYFFRLGDFEDKLLDLYEENPEFVVPDSRRNEMIERIKEGLDDLSITRGGLDWAVDFPLDEDHGIYVWVDALTNYISALGYPSEKFEKFWPPDFHVIGKDITWFHAVIWPALLVSADLELPDCVLVNGFWTRNGVKMSKSRGNVVDPVEMSEKYGADAFRYFLMRQKGIGEDGDFSEEDLTTRFNSELADTVGNLVHRTLTFIQRSFGGKVPSGRIDPDLESEIEERVARIERLMGEVELNKSLGEILSLAKKGNEYFQKCEPWKADREAASECLFNCINLVDTLAVLLYSFIPNSSERLLDMMNVEVEDLESAKNFRIGSNHEIREPKILFEKIKLEEKEVKEDMVSFDEFQELDLRIGKIAEVDPIEESDNLYRLVIDVGGDTKQSVAGLKSVYSVEDLGGIKVPVLVNLEPSEIMGIKSECMILAAVKDGNPVLLRPAEEVEPGAKIK